VGDDFVIGSDKHLIWCNKHIKVVVDDIVLSGYHLIVYANDITTYSVYMLIGGAYRVKVHDT
jgi:hypothetical protein